MDRRLQERCTSVKRSDKLIIVIIVVATVLIAAGLILIGGRL